MRRFVSAILTSSGRATIQQIQQKPKGRPSMEQSERESTNEEETMPSAVQQELYDGIYIYDARTT